MNSVTFRRDSILRSSTERKKGEKKAVISTKTLAASLVFMLIAAGCIIWIIVSGAQHGTGAFAQVRINGITAAELPLSNQTKRSFNGADGINVIVEVNNGSVFVSHSDCPDKICEKTGRINRQGQKIVCLPARTVIEIMSG